MVTPTPIPYPMSLDAFLTEAALAKFFDVKKENVRAWVDAGLPEIRLNARVRVFHEPSVVAWLKAKERSARSEPEQLEKNRSDTRQTG